jgi:shikimate kinase
VQQLHLKPMKSNIALIGFMGVGKSSVGKLLAERLKMKFKEMDSLIQEYAGKSIDEIFKSQGENGFRKIESEVTAKISGNHKTVISCGGGVVLNPSNIEHLKTNSLIVYLQAKPSTILQRLQQSKEVRPLLAVEDPAKTVDDLMRSRRPLYEQASDIIIDTSNRTPEDVVNDIMAELIKHESDNFQK